MQNNSTISASDFIKAAKQEVAHAISIFGSPEAALGDFETFLDTDLPCTAGDAWTHISSLLGDKSKQTATAKGLDADPDYLKTCEGAEGVFDEYINYLHQLLREA